MSTHLPRTISTKDDRVRVYLAGPGFGEAILVVIGRTILIGIDSCKSLLHASNTGPHFLEARLKELGKKHYVFWALTHYHSDHFESWSTVLDQFGDQISHVLTPLHYTEADLWYDIVAHEAKEATGYDAASFLARSEYGRIKSLIEDKSFKAKSGGHAGHCEWLHCNLKLPNQKRVKFRVRAFGPTTGELSRLVGKSAGRILTKREKAKTRAAANLGSYIICIEAGSFEGWFLGDATSRRTEEVVVSTAGRGNAANLCLKIAHHGARDGTSDGLLEAICDIKQPHSSRHALLTPFTDHDLPRSEVLEKLQSKQFSIYTSGSPRTEQSIREITGECGSVTNAVVTEPQASDDIISLDFPI